MYVSCNICVCLIVYVWCHAIDVCVFKCIECYIYVYLKLAEQPPSKDKTGDDIKGND
jgi:hypothetical protein